jgi:hypothetical protein
MNGEAGFMARDSELAGTGWASDLSVLDDADIKARLNALPVAGQVDLFLSLDWPDRLRIIKNSEAAPELVRALPDEEILLTMKGAGQEDSFPLVALSTGPQLQFILDVELWRRDTFDGGKAREWLHSILTCGEDKIIQFAEAVDGNLLILMLSQLMTLLPNEEVTELPKGLPSIMPDEFFTILSAIPAETENLRVLLRVLRQWDRDRFYRLLFDVYGCSGAEVEEAAFRWRSSRLEAKGLLEFDEAVEIYGYVSEQEAREMALGASDRFHRPVSGGIVPSYPVVLAESKTLFYKLLTTIDDSALRNRLRSEIAFAANRLLVADSGAIGEIASIKRAIRRLFSLVSVGLLFLTRGDSTEARHVIHDVPIKELFQVGFSRALDLRSTARMIACKWWPDWRKQGFAFLEFPRDEVMRGLMERVPQYYECLGGGSAGFRDFESMDEIGEVGQLLEEIAVVAEACFDKIGIPRPHEAKPALEGVLAGGPEDLTLRKLLLTGFVNFTLNGRFEITPVARRDVRAIFDKVLEQKPSGAKLVGEKVKTEFLAWLAGTTGFGDRRLEILERFFAGGIRLFDEEVGRIPSWQMLDPRYVSTLVFGRWPVQDER